MPDMYHYNFIYLLYLFYDTILFILFIKYIRHLYYDFIYKNIYNLICDILCNNCNNDYIILYLFILYYYYYYYYMDYNSTEIIKSRDSREIILRSPTFIFPIYIDFIEKSQMY